MEKIKEEIKIENPIDKKPAKRMDHVLNYFEFELGHSLETYNLLKDGIEQGEIKQKIEYNPDGSIKNQTFEELSTGKIIFFIDEERTRKLMEEKFKQIKEGEFIKSGGERIN